ncbi:hypothetical protein M8542_14325 [Amycolatopsis sp. OK19-0408]|uniref:Uncharacterized protein n=1 Tax=Amycolatopsis iheyensis TaxID=2945988 RepID=A0A9X2SIR2_9PSEU|nr:hypothetical protein [Amycolatopsis iheyensis]MCR6483997.1 hypothetical protein [Amycolatopsis iheyensis]
MKQDLHTGAVGRSFRAGQRWAAAALRDQHIEVFVAELPEQVRAGILEAQRRQYRQHRASGAFRKSWSIKAHLWLRSLRSRRVVVTEEMSPHLFV